MKVIIEDDDKKLIYPGDNQDVNIMLYKLFKLMYSNVEFKLHHYVYKQMVDLETFAERKIIEKVDHEFSFEIIDELNKECE